MSIKKRYNVLIYLTLSLALICIAVGLINNGGNNTANAIKEQTPMKVSTDPLQKTNKKLLIKDYMDKILKEEVDNKILTKEMIETWYKYDINNIEYYKSKTITNDTSLYLYKVEFKIYNQGASIPIENGIKEGTEYITTNLIVDIIFDNEKGSYVVDNIELP